MREYKSLIKPEAEKLQQQHIALNKAYQKKSAVRTSWENTLENFHGYISDIDPYLHRAYEEAVYTNQDLLELVICFLEVDLLFFRSGYIKEEMLRKVKRSPLNKNQAMRLRNVLIHAIKNMNSREYKAYCRLAIKIADNNLISSVETLAQFGEGSLKSRANLMLQYVS